MGPRLAESASVLDDETLVHQRIEAKRALMSRLSLKAFGIDGMQNTISTVVISAYPNKKVGDASYVTSPSKSKMTV